MDGIIIEKYLLALLAGEGPLLLSSYPQHQDWQAKVMWHVSSPGKSFKNQYMASCVFFSLFHKVNNGSEGDYIHRLDS